MVWGLTFPGNFGQFFPHGKFVGWREELEPIYASHVSEEEKAQYESPHYSTYKYYISVCLISEPGKKHQSYPPYRFVEPNEAPKLFQSLRPYRSLGALVQLNDRIPIVNLPLKEVIEGLEPGVHRFFPIDVLMPKQATPTEPYFVMQVGQYFNSFEPGQSDEASWRVDWQDYKLIDEGKIAGLAVSKAVFGNAHLWRESRISNELYCFSDELMAGIESLGLALPKHYKMREV